MAQLVGELLGDDSGLVVVALRGVNHQLAAARHGPGNGVGAEVLGNNQGERHVAHAHVLAGLFCVWVTHVSKAR